MMHIYMCEFYKLILFSSLTNISLFRDRLFEKF